MIHFRVDDYPGTKPEEFDRHNIENFYKFEAVMAKHGANPFVLGVIPRHVTDSDLSFLGMSPNVQIALHGVNHDERFPNEFREHQTEDDVYAAISSAKDRLESCSDQEVDTYIPPHNVIDRKTVHALVRSGFKNLMGGPGSDEQVIFHAMELGLNAKMYMPPYNYGRSDELIKRGAVEMLAPFMKSPNLHWHLGLHWTWEANIGLENLDNLLSQLCGII